MENFIKLDLSKNLNKELETSRELCAYLKE